MNDDKPGPARMPAEPFTALEQSAAAVLEMFYSYRRRGGTRIDAAILVAAQIAVGGKADE